MPTLAEAETDITAYDADQDGFLPQPACWTQQVASDLAVCEGISDLTEEHWEIIYYIRNYYLEFGAVPMMCRLCKGTRHKLNEIYRLFPSGLDKGVCRLAGLPRPLR